MFLHVEEAPPDPIFGITKRFQADTHPNKLNLGVGAYRDEHGKPWVLPVVLEAEQRLLAQRLYNKEYLPITGLPSYCSLARDVLLGKASPSSLANRVASVQSLSGTGALALALKFIRNFMPGPPQVYISNPTWANHKNLVNGAGLEFVEYRYYHAETKSLDFEGMLEDLRACPSGSIVLLHVCAHNPTGVDPTQDQWKEIAQVVKERSLLPLFDSAYQGFASGDLERDAFAVRHFDELGVEMIICQSFAKNFGLYGERVGAAHFVVDSEKTRDHVKGQVERLVRQLYSNPPRHGAEIVATALGDEELYALWRRDLTIMAERILSMRQCLYDNLKELGVPGSWEHILNQIGMFSYLGTTKAQTSRLINEHHIYMTATARISMAGLNAESCRYLAESILEVVTCDDAKM